MDLNPYVVFLPSEHKIKILTAIFGSKAAVDILRFCLDQGISSKIFQKDLVAKLGYSNKTIIQNLKSLTKLGALNGNIERIKNKGRTVWVKTYCLSDSGKWFALLMAKEKDLSTSEKAEILQNLFTAYTKWTRKLSEKLNVSNKTLESIFMKEMRKRASG